MQYKIYLHIKYVDYFALLSMYRIGTLYDYCVADQTAGHVSIYRYMYIDGYHDDTF